MSKVIYFKERTPIPLKRVKDKPGVSGCQQCYFKGHPDGCVTRKEEFFAGTGYCEEDRHHYEEAQCAS